MIFGICFNIFWIICVIISWGLFFGAFKSEKNNFQKEHIPFVFLMIIAGPLCSLGFFIDAVIDNNLKWSWWPYTQPKTEGQLMLEKLEKIS